MRLYYLLFGYRRLTVPLSEAADALNVCMKYGYVYRDMSPEGERVGFTFTLFTASRFASRCASVGITADTSSSGGLPISVAGCLRRPGIVLGFLAALFILIASQQHVWDIRIGGNVSLTEAELNEVLSLAGLNVGSYIPKLDTDLTEGRALLLCDRLAWISVNMRGTVAYVEVMEKIPNEGNASPLTPANIVAAREGTVVEFIAYSGYCELSVGDAVKAGDLLISGVYGEKTHGVSVTRAAGYVKAKTLRTFEVKIPLEHTEKRLTASYTGSRSLIFFNNKIKVFINGRNLTASCDTIEEEKKFSLFGRLLPFGISTEQVNEYAEVRECYSVAEASAIAFGQLEAAIVSELADAEILARREQSSVENGTYVLRCEISCIENIALVKEFSFSAGG